MPALIRTSDHLTIVFDDGQTGTIYPGNGQFEAVRDAVAAKDWETARKLVFPALTIQETLDRQVGGARVVVDNGIVLFDGAPMHNTLTRRMLQMIDEGFDVEPMKKFLVNLYDNPSKRAVDELYSFLEVGNLPITDDGHFLAYKVVGQDYMDKHTHTVPNKPAALFTDTELSRLPLTVDNNVTVNVEDGVTVVSMPRNSVDEDKNRTCSSGLHFCSRAYVSVMGEGRLITLKINPRDVVAIPADYNDTKGRTCRYEIFNELSSDDTLEGVYRNTRPIVSPEVSVVVTDTDEWLPENDETIEPNLDELVSIVNDAEIYNAGYEDGYQDALDDDSDEDDDDFDDEDDDWLDDEDDEVDVLFDNIVSELRQMYTMNSDLPLVTGDDVPAESVVASSFTNAPTDEIVEDTHPIKAYYEDGDLYNEFVNVDYAARHTGANKSSIYKALNGTRKTAGGFTWKRS